MLLVLVLAACGDDPSGERDAQLVHCLTAAEPARVAEAAVALGVADRVSRGGEVVVGDDELSIEEWRERAPDDFARTCAALAAADAVGAGSGDGSSDDGLLTSVASLLAAILGGAAAGLATEYLNRRGRRFQYAVELRASLTSFQRAGVAYLRGWREPGTPRLPATALTSAGDELADKLRHVAEERPAWTGLITLRRKLSDGPLGGDLDGWLVPAATRSERLEELQRVLRDIADRGERTAVAIEKPMLNWLLLHRSPTSVGSGR